MRTKGIKMCKRCEKRPATKPHPCPFSEDVHGDSKTLCTCCESCQSACADEI